MSKRRVAGVPAINSVGYWDRRFQRDWEDRGGPGQTRFFAHVFASALPDWVAKQWAEERFSLMDVGCAQGDASEVLTTRFPQVHFVGVDVSEVGIQKASDTYTSGEFKRIEPDWSDLPAAEFILCSNTIEHLTDWRARLAILCRHASKAVFVLVPYCEEELEPEHVARFDERALPTSVDGKRLAFVRVVDTRHLPASRWNGKQMLAVYASPDFSIRSRSRRARGDLYSGVDLRGASDEEIVDLLMQVSPMRRVAAENSSENSSDIDKVNKSWKEKFEEMVKSFEGQHQKIIEDNQRKVAALEERIHASVVESQATIKRLSEERDSANLRSEIAERRLAFNEEMSSARLAHQEDVARKEQELQKSSLEMSFAKEVLEKERELKRLVSEVDELRAQLLAGENQQADRFAIEHADLIKRYTDEIDGLNSAHAAEIGRLTASLAEFDEKLSLFQAERAKEVRDLEAERERLAEVIERLSDESRNLLSGQQRLLGYIEGERQGMANGGKGGDLKGTHATGQLRFADAVAVLIDENRRLLADREQPQAHEDLNIENHNLKNMLARELERSENLDQMFTVQRLHYEQHLESMNRELDRLSSELAQLIQRGLEENNRQADMLWAAASHNTRIASALAEAADRERNNAPMHLLRRITGVFRRDRNPVPEIVEPLPSVPLPVRLQPTMHMITHILDAFKFERNFAGASRGGVEAAGDDVGVRDVAPVQAEADLLDDPDRVVVAMQLEAFDRGGLERVVFDLCSGMDAVGVPVLILCKSAGDLAEEIAAKNIKVILFDNDATYEAALKDNCVTHLFLHHSYTGTDIALRLGIEIFDVVHNTYFWKIADPAPVRKVGQSAAGVVCVSSRVRDFHVRAFGIPEDNTRLINNAVNTDGLIVPEVHQLRQMRSSSNQTTFLNVANFYPAKAQVALISGFAQAYRIRPEIRLMIAGAESTPEIAEKVRLLIRQHGLQDAVTLLGHCTREDLSRHYAASHAFLLPSIFEGYSVSAIEAATFGLPLIMTDVGGARDLICDGDCGILLPPIVDDLAKYTPEMIDEIGSMPENAVTSFLAEALVTIARDRDYWLECGLTAMSKPRSLPSVVDDYLDLVRRRECADGVSVAPAAMRA